MGIEIEGSLGGSGLEEGRKDGLDGEILSSTRPADELAEWGMGPMSEGGRWFEVRSWKG